MRRFGIAITAAVLFSLLAASQAHADATWWTGTTGDWHDPLNWDNGIPTSNDVAYVANGGTAQIFADAESDRLYVGRHSSAVVEQDGGTNQVGYLEMNSVSSYTLSGGTLSISDSADIDGSFHFDNGDGILNVNGGLVNFADAVIDGTSSATFNSAANTLTIFPTGFDPAAEFGSYNALGLVHNAGSTLVISSGEGFAGYGSISDAVENEGVITPSGGSLEFRGGLTISNGGTLDSSTKIFHVDDTTITIAASGGTMLAHQEYIGYEGTATFNQYGGTNTVSNVLYIGDRAGSAGTYNLIDGDLSVDLEYAGDDGAAEFNQAGGIHTVHYMLYYYSSTYNLSGGTLAAAEESTYRFNQTGGTHTADIYLKARTYNLSAGHLSAGMEIINGDFVQTGGTNNAGYLYVTDRAGASYTMSGGTLAINDSAESYGAFGAFNFTSGDWTLNIDGGVANFEDGIFSDASVASFNSAAGTLTIFPTGFNPATEFGYYDPAGMIHIRGGTLTVPAGNGFSGRGTINDPVVNEGNITASGGPLLFNNHITISNGGSIDLTGPEDNTYDLFVSNDSIVTIEASGGQLLAGHEYIGYGGTGTFNQDGGNNTVGALTLGDEYAGFDSPPFTLDSIGIYNLSAGELSTVSLHIADKGTGEFNQTGGTNTSDFLYLGEEWFEGSSFGTYNLYDGQLISDQEYIGWSGEGTGVFNQSGGTNSVVQLHVRSGSTYSIVGGTLQIRDSGDGGAIQGTVDFGGGSGTLYLGDGVVDLREAVFTDTASATFATIVNSLAVLSPGFNPATDFGTYDQPGITYVPGTTMVVPEGYSFTGHYDFNDPLEIRGTLIASGGVFGFKDSLTISNGGTFDTGAGVLELQNGDTATIAASGGNLIVPEVHLGYDNEGVFNQEGGTVTISGSIQLAYDAVGSEGIYNLSDGELATTDLIVGDGKGRGKFNQSGGALSVSGTLDISSPTANSSVYFLNGGTVEAHDVFLGGKGVLNITNSDAYIEINGSLTLQDNAVFMAVPGTTIHMTGSDFENTSTSLNNLGGLENTTFIFEDSSDTDTFEIASYDYGLIEENFYGNFGLEGLILAGSYDGTLQLLDAHINFTGLGPSTQAEALYVRNLVLGSHATLDLNGYNLYAMEFTSYGGTVLNGEIQAISSTYIPEPATIALISAGLLGLAGLARKKCRSIEV
ncbi:MAG: PEP-CTERM sorting domain-containing protein [Planctomycetota bacterium]